ncbi:head completion/stabilization protein [Pseudoalteromonas sp. C12FD-1]|uniref:head completion/stabilization protein n=1 Tax=Pseudoalteromonas sp. C12FD-1 TaxID=3131979 RepID=UPI00307F48ED
MSFGFEATAQNSIEIDAASGWPALSTGEFRDHRRIPEFYEETVIADSLNRSALEVQQQILKYIMKDNTDVAFTQTNGVPNFNDKQQSVYRGAVYARSHSDLMGYFSAVDQKDAGNNKADSVDQQDAILAQSNRSIRLLLGLGRAGVHTL